MDEVRPLGQTPFIVRLHRLLSSLDGHVVTSWYPLYVLVDSLEIAWCAALAHAGQRVGIEGIEHRAIPRCSVQYTFSSSRLGTYLDHL